MRDKQKSASERRDTVMRDWQPLFGAVKDVIDWALDIAVKLSRHVPDDIVAIEKVRACFHAWLDGKPSELDVTDLLVAFGTILAAIEIDLGIDSVDLLAPMRALVDAPSTLPRVLRMPGAAWNGPATIVIRRPRTRTTA
jgi:hypothetical protein